MKYILDQAVEGLPVTAQLVDYWHLVEKLGAAVKAMKTEETGLLSRWKSRLLKADKATDEIEAEFMVWKVNCPGPLPEGLHNALT